MSFKQNAAKRVKVYFRLRDSNATTETPIFAQISLGGNVRFKYPTAMPPEKVNPMCWDRDKMRAKTGRREVGATEQNRLKNLNRRLDYLNEKIVSMAEEYWTANRRQPLQMEFVELLDEALGRKQKEKLTVERVGLVAFTERYIEELRGSVSQKTGRLHSNSTLRGYGDTLSLLRRFAKAKPRYRNLWFEDVTMAFYHDLMDYMTKERTLATNTMGKHIKTIKTVMGLAEERGLHHTTDYRHRNFRKLTEDTEAIALDEDELGLLMGLELENNKRLERVRDLMIVGCWTGLRFSDFTTIKKENFVRDGQRLNIEKDTKKTGVKVTLPVHQMVEQVMNRYEGKTLNSLPKPLSNQKMNLYLKELGKLAGLNEQVMVRITKGGESRTRFVSKYELITTHVCRRSFATNLYRSGIPTLDIMQMTGHRTERAFMAYIKIKPREAANKVHDLWRRAEQKMRVV
jgi:site-specific recombinase XerD